MHVLKSAALPRIYFWYLASKGPITWGRLARLAGLARFAGISARLWNIKINFAIT